MGSQVLVSEKLGSLRALRVSLCPVAFAEGIKTNAHCRVLVAVWPGGAQALGRGTVAPNCGHRRASLRYQFFLVKVLKYPNLKKEFAMKPVFSIICEMEPLCGIPL